MFSTIFTIALLATLAFSVGVLCYVAVESLDRDARRD
jgi:hypothetical protein